MDVPDGDEMDVILPEQNLGVKACLQIVPADSGHIFYKDVRHFSRLNVRNKLLPRGSLEVAAAYFYTKAPSSGAFCR